MSEPTALTFVTTTVHSIDADTIFSALNDSSRRQILVSLFDGQFHSVAGVGGSLPKHRDLLRKYYAVLVKAGLIITQDDPTKPRRSVYKLSPAVKAEATPTGRTLGIVRC